MVNRAVLRFGSVVSITMVSLDGIVLTHKVVGSLRVSSDPLFKIACLIAK